MENQKKSTGKTVLIVLLLIVTIVSLVLATYAWAKYTSTTTGTAEAQVAKWDVTFTENKENFVGTYSHIAATKIAPGASGTFDIEAVPGNTETCFDYVIKIDSFEFVDDKGNVLPADTTILEAADAATAGIDGVTTDIKLADLRSHIVVKNGETVLNTGLTVEGEYHIAGCDAGTSTALKQTINWAWDYEKAGDANYDVVDTAAGRYVAAGNTLQLKFNYTITATQTEPVRK